MIVRLRALSAAIVAAGVLHAAHARAAEPDPLSEGRLLYSKGLLPSGRAVSAIVLGDVPVAGTQFTCISCHQRSGLGISEGGRSVPPVAGIYLKQPDRQRQRPAYDERTLARAVRQGIDAAGRPLDRVMPRYELSEGEIRALSVYMDSLSARLSPGVNEETIEIATPITSDTDPAARQTMLDLLQAYVKNKNGQTRTERRRAALAPFFMENKMKAFREWVLHPWLLEGEPDTWRRQLEAHYRRTPVFALLSGLSTRSWQPIHEFCEREGIPCVLPNTDLPHVARGDFYTLYFSAGLALEARLIAAHLAQAGGPSAVVQVYREQEDELAGAQALREALDEGSIRLHDLLLPAGAPLSAESVARSLREHGASALVLWARSLDLDPSTRWPDDVGGATAVYLSATLLADAGHELPAPILARAVLVSPFTLPAERESRLRRLASWLEREKLPLTDVRLQAQTYFACLVLHDGLTHIGQRFYRDYFLETIDHANVAAFSIVHPRLSLGPGQRLLAKGGYLVRLAAPAGTKDRAVWIVPP